MAMTPAQRKLALTAHVVASVGWLGAVAGFLAIAAAALTSADLSGVRAAYLAMEIVTQFALVPLAIASLLTGVAQALGTRWGLLRHYWVAFKLLLNVLATGVLLLYTRTIGQLADAARDSTIPLAELRVLGWSPALHAAAALLVLLVATVLAVYKPRGLTPYGERAQRRGATDAPPRTNPP